MEAKELMIGDMLMAHFNDGESEFDFPVVIDGIDSNCTLVDGTCSLSWTPALKEHCNIEYAEYVEPIHLTEDILMANGFEKNDNVQGWQYPNDRVIFCLEELSNVFIWNGVYNDICIEHVHVLQHVLRLCCLNELADNFKVE